jgi:asparaginyl-tRNA synthetase
MRQIVGPAAYINDILDGKHPENQTVILRGWVYNTRSSGKVKFLQLRDGTDTIQCVLFPANTAPEAMSDFDKLTQETSLAVEGTLSKSPKGVWELQLKRLEIIGVSVEYPITPKEHGPAFLQDHRHLWIRSKRQHAILRIRSEIISAARDFFDSRGFTGFDAPIFTPNACEGTTNLFEVNYFDEQKAFLTQSGQLYGEAGAMAFGKCYVFGPTFRAEKSKTRRHLTEFWMLEPEVAFQDINGNMDLAEDMICHIVERVLKNRRRELADLERDVSKLEVIKKPFPRIHYKEAAAILEKESKDNFKTGMDFGGGDETILASKFEKPIFVHGFPTAIKAFYMKEDPADPTYTLSCDLLAPDGYGEIIGGGQREESIDVLKKKIAEHGLDQSVFEWFLDLRRFGSVPHSGFGMGIERCTAWICGAEHVRECIPFPRMLYRLTP